MIHIDEYLDHGPRFRLDAGEASYAFMIFDRRFPVHLYWGGRLSRMPDPGAILRPCPRDYAVLRQGSSDFSPWPESGAGYTPSTMPMELGVWGWGDDRPGSVHIRYADGTPGTELVYEGWEIPGSPLQPEGMPLIHEQAAECETLRITLKDPARSLRLHMHYTVHERMNAVIRWIRFENSGDDPVILNNPPAFSLDLQGTGKSLVRLQGGWASERHVDARALPPGISRQESRAGAVGHGQTPFIALGDPGAHEFSGTVRAFSLAYSGNFYAQTAADEHMNCRVSMGVNQYRGNLATGETFDTPAAVLVYSNRGFSGMSGNFHHLIRDFIQSKELREWPRHVIINSWEAMYFDVTEKKILNLARKGKEVGAELLVLDDGWFSARRNDQTSLGDWDYNHRRFPRGLGALGDDIRGMGLKFGIWMEPEMVSPDSRLYREHPRWIISIPERTPSLARHQLILDLSRDEVVDYLKQTMTKVLKEARPDYLKWDMNRNITEPGFPALSGERQGEGMHRYILGLYRLIRYIRQEFPHMIIEGCAGGGGRMDLSMTAYSPRFWTSDQTDAVERLPIQYGSSLIFPPETLGAHVSAVPNHQVGRITPLESRCITAAAFSFGCELNPAGLSAGERQILKAWSLRYRELRDMIRRGNFYRLRGPLEPGWQTSLPESPEFARSRSYAWMLASRDFQTLGVFFHRPVKTGLSRSIPLRLYLPDSCLQDSYREKFSGNVYEGATLRDSGIHCEEADGDYMSRFMLLTRE
ncbi:alpha-galactosidase [Salinispira pacifica]|uniref:Alpha-galactosidase n=1 Tax=Salinispira pacifica TaxID=1307761 RepID=V5WKE2_9SPIO|nr:alpha-galactosidase [Salinispira pacifica]AHC16110.1 Alpha-galactosidase [Salinispira pacifica]